MRKRIITRTNPVGKSVICTISNGTSRAVIKVDIDWFDEDPNYNKTLMPYENTDARID